MGKKCQECKCHHPIHRVSCSALIDAGLMEVSHSESFTITNEMVRKLRDTPQASCLLIGSEYEQGDPGWYLYESASGKVRLVIDDEIPITVEEVRSIRDAMQAGDGGEL